MKILSKIFFIVILLGVAFLNTTCGKQSLFSHVTWEGHVYDSTGKPVSGIDVSLWGGESTGGSAHYQEFIIGTCTTDASGHFYIHGKAARQDAYFPGIYSTSLPSSFIFFAEDPSHTNPVSSKDLTTTKFTVLYVP